MDNSESKDHGKDSNLSDYREQENSKTQYEQKREASSNAIMSWFGNKSQKGAGLLYKFTHNENRLVRWILEKHGFDETAPDYNLMS